MAIVEPGAGNFEVGNKQCGGIREHRTHPFPRSSTPHRMEDPLVRYCDDALGYQSVQHKTVAEGRQVVGGTDSTVPCARCHRLLAAATSKGFMKSYHNRARTTLSIRALESFPYNMLRSEEVDEIKLQWGCAIRGSIHCGPKRLMRIHACLRGKFYLQAIRHNPPPSKGRYMVPTLVLLGVQ
jgi:hypothetical protein